MSSRFFRPTLMRRSGWMGLLALLAGLSALASAAERTVSKEDAAKEMFFSKQVRPLLVEHCFMCHGPEKQEGGLRLDSRDAMLAGGDSGPAIVPGNVADSLLADAIRYGDTVQMPPTEKLGDKQIEILIQWIDDGAVWPKPAR